MIYSPTELVILARAYCANGTLMSSLGKKVLDNYKFFPLLEAGKGAHSGNLEKASDWFEENWPADIEWPKEVARTRPERAA